MAGKSLCFVMVINILMLKNTAAEESSTSSVDNSTSPNPGFLDSFLKGYDKRIRPFFLEKPLTVRVDMFITNIWSMEEVNMDFTLDFYLRQYWQDPRLNFSTADTNISQITLSGEIISQIWLPTTYFIRAKKGYRHDVTTDNYLLQIGPNGQIFYSIRLTVTAACTFDLRRFPSDRQMCELPLESFGYTAADLVYRWNPPPPGVDSPVGLAENLEMPQFNIGKVETHESVNVYNVGKFSTLSIKLRFNRRLGYFIIETYIPSVLTVIISWFSFWISPESAPARVALGITTVLTMTTICSSARESLPKVSYVKAMDWYLLICLIFAFGALLEYALVNFAANKRNLFSCTRAKQFILRKKASLLGRHEPKATAVVDPPASPMPGIKSHAHGLLDHPTNAHNDNGFIQQSKSIRYRWQDQNESAFPMFPPAREIKEQMGFPRKRSSQSEATVTTINEQAPELDPESDIADGLFVDKYARFLFPLIFLVINCIYWSALLYT